MRKAELLNHLDSMPDGDVDVYADDHGARFLKVAPPEGSPAFLMLHPAEDPPPAAPESDKPRATRRRKTTRKGED